MAEDNKEEMEVLEAMEELEKGEVEMIPIPTGISGVLQILAGKVSRKAAVVSLAMVLVYLLAVTPTVVDVAFPICIITGLAVFFTILQWILDKRGKKVEWKIMERKSRE